MSEQADIVTKELVERFLMWQLPKSVCSDLCVTNPKYSYPRSGTNLLTADEARQMVEYLFAPHLESLAILQDDQRKLDRVLQILGIADTDLDAAAYCEQLCQQRDVLGERAEKAESALATAEAAALERAAIVRDALTDAAQIIDAVKMEWEPAGSWSAWDQAVRDKITAALIPAARSPGAGWRGGGGEIAGSS